MRRKEKVVSAKEGHGEGETVHEKIYSESSVGLGEKPVRAASEHCV